MWTDHLGRPVHLQHPLQRIVSLCPSQTELLFALGLGSRVVGATQWCIHPAEQMSQVVRVGGTKKINLRKTLALKPDLVLCEQEENTPEMVEALAAHVPVYVTKVESVADALRMIRDVGAVCQVPQPAQQLADELAAGFARLARDAAQLPSQRVAYLIWRDPWMGVGQQTYIHDVLRHLNWTNVLQEVPGRYPTLAWTDLQALAPDRLLLSSEPYTFTEVHVQELQPAFPQTRVQLVDGEVFSWYGSRMRLALPVLRELAGLDTPATARHALSGHTSPE